MSFTKDTHQLPIQKHATSVRMKEQLDFAQRGPGLMNQSIASSYKAVTPNPITL